MKTSRPTPLRIGLVDMNNGHENQAMRCFRGILAGFAQRARARNPGLEVTLVEVSPRDQHTPVPRDCDLYLSSGGPGSPFEHDHDAWLNDYKAFLDGIVDDNVAHGPGGRAFFGVCYSYELVVRHFGVATMAPRASRKFGVMPVYMTDDGQAHPLLQVFGDRLFAFEHRNWEAVGLDERKLASLGGRVLARESREGLRDKGEALLGFDIAPGVETVQFHPEADRAGVVAWVSRPDQAQAFRDAYGELTYQRMLRTLDDPKRLARTFAMLVPGWLTRKFNERARVKGWQPVEAPVQDMSAFGSPVAASQPRP